MQTFSWTTSRSSLRTKPPTGQPAARRGFILLWVTFWCVVSFLIPSRFLYSSVRVVGASMSPTLVDGDWRLVNRWLLRIGGANHGDMVVLEEPFTRIKVVKRIIGLPGDTVEFRPDAVYVNYRELEEHYLPRQVYTWSRKHANKRIHLGPDQFFVLGDNRLFSVDSRSYGPVPTSDLLGLICD